MKHYAVFPICAPVQVGSFTFTCPPCTTHLFITSAPSYPTVVPRTFLIVTHCKRSGHYYRMRRCVVVLRKAIIRLYGDARIRRWGFIVESLKISSINERRRVVNNETPRKSGFYLIRDCRPRVRQDEYTYFLMRVIHASV